LHGRRLFCSNSVPTNFDYSRSTEDNYSVEPFVGIHADIRRLLDFSFHEHYRHDRIALQDKIVTEMSTSGPGKHTVMPWVIFTAGAMGSGKGYVVDWMQAHGYLPLDQFVVVDPDAFELDCQSGTGT